MKFILKLKFSVPTTTTAPPICQSGWSQSYNEDSPYTGDGDTEFIPDILEKYGYCYSGRIVDIDCYAVMTGEWVEGK